MATASCQPAKGNCTTLGTQPLTVLGESARGTKVWISYHPKFEVIGLTSAHRLLVPELMDEARPDAFGLDREVTLGCS